MRSDCNRLLGELCRRYPWCDGLVTAVTAMQGFDEAHGLPHTLRVTCLAVRLARLVHYPAEDRVLAAALLHDAGRSLEDRLGVNHALISALLARELLHGIFGEEALEEIVKAIVLHSYSLGRGRDVCSASILARILSDADKLDAIGAIGVSRAIIHGCRVGRRLMDTLEHFYEKLRRLDKLLCLEESRKIARERMKTMSAFFAALEREFAEVYVDPEAVLPPAKSFSQSLLEGQAGGYDEAAKNSHTSDT